VAALASLLADTHTYDDVKAEAARLERRWRTRGIGLRHMQTVARELGVELVMRRRLALDTDCGVVVVHGPHVSRDGHYVAVCAGRVLDPGTGESVPWRAYQARYEARFTTLLGLRLRRGATARLAVAVARRPAA
jgi:hypothetical protein